MPARPIVHANEAVDAAFQGSLGPFSLGDIVVHGSPHRMHLLDNPLRISQRGDEKPNPFLQRNVHPFAHSVFVNLGRLFDDGIKPDGFVRQFTDQSQSFA